MRAGRGQRNDEPGTKSRRRAGRTRLGQPLNPPDWSTLYTPGEKGYNDYPALA